MKPNNDALATKPTAIARLARRDAPRTSIAGVVALVLLSALTPSAWAQRTPSSSTPRTPRAELLRARLQRSLFPRRIVRPQLTRTSARTAAALQRPRANANATAGLPHAAHDASGLAAASSSHALHDGGPIATTPAAGNADLVRHLDASDADRARWSPQLRASLVRQFGSRRVALRRQYLAGHSRVYDVEIPMERFADHIRDQDASGRCWIYASLRMAESDHAERTGQRVTLSESYVNYHAWATRADWVLENAVRNPETTELGDMGEGGWFHYAAALIEQHGLVPASAMPDTFDAHNTDTMIELLRTTLAAAQTEMARVPLGPNTIRDRQAIATRYRNIIRQRLRTSLGDPPERFTVDGREFTPQSYAREHVQFNPREYVLLGSFERHPEYASRTVNGSNGLPNEQMFNVPRHELEANAKAAVAGGRAVWFAAEVGAGNQHIVPNNNAVAYPPEARGLMSVDAFDFTSSGEMPHVAKATLERAGLNESNHAMAFTGFRNDPANEGRVAGWKVDNSWGTKSGDNGHYHMDRSFFDRYVNYVVVRRQDLTKTVRERMDAEPTQLRLPGM